MIDFLTFNKFISLYMLVIFYYLGAVIIPLMIFFSKSYFVKKYSFLEKFMITASESTPLRIKIIFIFCIIFCEILWRMMFEVIIGYFQMHDYLQQLQR